jgi:tetratricopeptide (TPR) repeat protein
MPSIPTPAGPLDLTTGACAGLPRLKGRGLQLIRLLAEPGPPLSTNALITTVWPTARNPEAALRETVRRLRHRYERDPRTPTWLLTVRGGGYRLVVERTGATAAPTDPFWQDELTQIRDLLVTHDRVHLVGPPGSGRQALRDAWVRAGGPPDPVVVVGHVRPATGTAHLHLRPLDPERAERYLAQLCADRGFTPEEPPTADAGGWPLALVHLADTLEVGPAGPPLDWRDADGTRLGDRIRDWLRTVVVADTAAPLATLVAHAGAVPLPHPDLPAGPLRRLLRASVARRDPDGVAIHPLLRPVVAAHWPDAMAHAVDQHRAGVFGAPDADLDELVQAFQGATLATDRETLLEQIVDRAARQARLDELPALVDGIDEPPSLAAWACIARAAYDVEAHRLDRAAAACRASLALHPTAEAWRRLASVHSLKRRMDEAVDAAQQAIALSEPATLRHAQALRTYATILADDERPGAEHATRAAQAALLAIGDHGNALVTTYDLALLVADRDLDAGITALQDLIDQGLRQPVFAAVVRGTLGVQLFRAGRLRAARQALDTAIEGLREAGAPLYADDFAVFRVALAHRTGDAATVGVVLAGLDATRPLVQVLRDVLDGRSPRPPAHRTERALCEVLGVATTRAEAG